MKTYPGYYLHQLGPYIGKIRPSLARKLVLKYSESGDLIWDPFCGSGTIALECKLLGRNTIATDTNPYACSLTRAKLNSPNSFEEGLRQLETTLKQKKNSKKKLGKSPEWVRKFFHPKTLSETRALMNLFVARKQFFLIGCLLHILHHQRPG
ncbi:MAG: site-specific DNA-methyltransferase, partial [Bacteroidetes bacterium]|nr:site-specific DNA-methyltransferase [Bacteroidota bacterium]